MMMICDPRITAAAPVTWLTDREMYMDAGGGQDAEQYVFFPTENILLLV